jgi:transcriptional regulator with XRE-family HTH domain
MPRTKSLWDKNYRRLVDRLVEARKAAGLSQIQVAKAMRLGQSAVSKIETSERRIDPIELQRLAKLYGTSVQRLLGE